METIFKPEDSAVTVEFQSITLQAKFHAEQDLANALQRPRGALPNYTTTFRVLEAVWNCLRTPAPPGDGTEFLARLKAAASSFGRLHTAAENMLAQQRTKLFEGVMTPAMVAEMFAKAAGLQADTTGTTTKGIVLSQTTVYDILFFAVPGAAIQRTQTQVAYVCAQLLLLSRQTSGYADEDRAAAWLAMTNLIRLATTSLNETAASGSLVAGKQEEQFQIRLNVLREHTALISGAVSNAVVQVTNHFMRWLLHPWVKSSVYADQANQLMHCKAEYDMRSPSPEPYGTLSSLGSDSMFDQDIVSLPALRTGALAQQVRSLPKLTSTMQGPLAAEYAWNLGITESDVIVWIAEAWRLVRNAESIAGFTQLHMQGGVRSVPALDPECKNYPEIGITGLSEVAGYPVYPSQRPDVPFTTRVWPTRKLNLDTWSPHMRWAVVDKIAEHTHLPVRVIGTPQYEAPLNLQQVLPLFTDFDDAGPKFTPSLEAFAQTSKQTVQHVVATLQAIISTGANSMMLRSIATSLRLVGQLMLDDEPIEPFGRQWYHSRTFDPKCFGTSIKLAESQNGKKRLSLKPFAFLPLSALMADMPINLHRVETSDLLINEPLVFWCNTNGAAAPSSVAINGWTSGSDVLDIVLIAISRDPQNFFVTGGQTGMQLRGRSLNSVISVAEPAKAFAVKTLPVPASMTVSMQ